MTAKTLEQEDDLQFHINRAEYWLKERVLIGDQKETVFALMVASRMLLRSEKEIEELKAHLAEVSQLRDQYQGDLIKVNAALDGHANEIIRLTARLAEAISLMKEAAPAIDTIAFGLSERFDRFLAVYAKEDKP